MKLFSDVLAFVLIMMLNQGGIGWPVRAQLIKATLKHKCYFYPYL